MRKALTLVEIVISLTILVTIMAALFSQILPLSSLQRQTKERQRAMSVAKVMAERLQGAAWHRLGGSAEPFDPWTAWSWHRRLDPDPSDGNPPLTETDTTTMKDADNNDVQVHNLLGQGILTEPSGLDELKVYVEYYDMSILDASTSHASWINNTKDDAYIMEEDYGILDLSEVSDAVVFRVVVTWKNQGGIINDHEIVLARRR